MLPNPQGQSLASCDARLLTWGYDKLNLPEGMLKIPALNSNHGSNGISKFRVINMLQKAAKAGAQSKAKAKSQVPEPLVGPKVLRPSTKVIKAHLKPKGSVANAAGSSGLIPQQPARLLHHSLSFSSAASNGEGHVPPIGRAKVTHGCDSCKIRSCLPMRVLLQQQGLRHRQPPESRRGGSSRKQASFKAVCLCQGSLVLCSLCTSIQWLRH